MGHGAHEAVDLKSTERPPGCRFSSLSRRAGAPPGSGEGGQVAFEDGPAVRRVGRCGALDAGPGVVEVAGGDLSAEDRVVADADPVGGAREGQDVEVAAALLPDGVRRRG